MDEESLSNRLRRFELSLRDMMVALHTLKAAEKSADIFDRSVFLDMAVIAYARPFVRNFGTKGTEILKLEHLFAHPLAPKDLAIHTLALKLRNSVIAHSDAEMAWSSPSVIEGVSVFGTTISAATDLQPELPRFRGLANSIKEALMEKLYGPTVGESP